MSTLVLSQQGRFGNQAVQFLFAYAIAKRHGMKFECPEWIGEKIFDLPKYDRPNPDWPPNLARFSELDIEKCVPLDRAPWNLTEGAFEFRGYAQTSFSARQYTKREAQEWLRFKPEILRYAAEMKVPLDSVVAHIRRGDYEGYGYPLVSYKSYHTACVEHGLDAKRLLCCSEERPSKNSDLDPFADFLSDFMLLIRSAVLLRANSTFSWIAGLLREGPVFSPLIDGLEGGKEHDCRFVPGNSPRLANLDFTQELHVAP